ncbi:hypothetical protein ACDW82_16780 [Alcaligenes faecalis]|jgi:hypothetical protein|uniref:hypothetical protein n=1 Tax=Alcaligenes TaxID=507 RepID=UPI0005A93AEF|nr:MULTISPECIES: hypothetical protein [Alcaligenes]ATH99040.1 hypothetical protein CPY64_04495 [Alcaligenes faecalis]AYZ91826.1 hypothetical protein EGY22_10265 [Alcaligenes faecalis]MCX5595719.1 hypothetical protein [Alcaligenes faecalis]QQC32364.1 hypothetical protein I6H81_17380 [Alcaligenes faecalis]CAJ0899356.1 Alginate_exp domain-containing protein [Alcaligenes faecalis subsp. faecalis]
MHSIIRASLLAAGILCVSIPQSQAYELYREEGTELNADLTVVFGVLNSKHNYIGRPGRFGWQEGFAKYGLSGETDRIGAGSVYGSLALISSGTWGDGDPGGYSIGKERRTSFEDAYVGWRTGSLFPFLGQDGIDISFGRQSIKVGRGFLVYDDAANPGRGMGREFDRGGAYYLGPRHSFAKTAVLRLGGKEGLHGSAMWIKSDNPAMAKTEMAVGTVEYTAAEGTVGFSYIRGLDVDKQYADAMALERKNMNIYGLFGEGSAGIENAKFGFDLARQDKQSGHETAWSVQAGYTFADMAWSPEISYRYSHYSKRWDPFFTGGYLDDGWTHGEVAGNYVPGAFASNLAVHAISLRARPYDNLTVGAIFYNYRTVANRDVLNSDANAVDLYLDWAVTDHITITPLVGLYKPRQYEANGGSQNRNASTNIYTQLVLSASF